MRGLFYERVPPFRLDLAWHLPSGMIRWRFARNSKRRKSECLQLQVPRYLHTVNETEYAVLDAEDAGTNEAAERYLKRVAEAHYQAPRRFAEELVAGRRCVFFSAGDFDLQALHRFSHRADTFIFVDVRRTEAEHEDVRDRLVNRQTKAGDGLVAVTKGLHPEAAYRVVAEVAGELVVMRNEAWTMIPELQDRRPYGSVHRLERRVGGTSRDIWVLLLSGGVIPAYERLFINRGTAPEILSICLPRFDHAALAEAANGLVANPPHGVPVIEQQWGNLVGWDGDLGQLLRAHNAPLPNYLVAEEVMGWPTHALWYRVARWRSRWITPVFTMRNEPWPDLVPVPPGRRRVVVTRRPVNPLDARKVGAIVVGHNTYRQYRWPDGVLVILAGPPIFPDQAVADGPGVMNLQIAGIPLLRALAEIERVCGQRGITNVAVQEPLGFGDEADDLAMWRQQEGQITELTLHVDCDGHLIDFGQVADAVE